MNSGLSFPWNQKYIRLLQLFAFAPPLHDAPSLLPFEGRKLSALHDFNVLALSAAASIAQLTLYTISWSVSAAMTRFSSSTTVANPSSISLTVVPVRPAPSSPGPATTTYLHAHAGW